ncbi:MAG: hypothetical protein R3B06_07945 [Kofleriaceae bacterium]
MSHLTTPVTSPPAAASAASTRTTAPSSLFKRCRAVLDALTHAAGRVVAIVVDVVRDSCAAVGRATRRARAYLVELTGWSAGTVEAFAFVVILLLSFAIAYAGRSWLW